MHFRFVYHWHQPCCFIIIPSNTIIDTTNTNTVELTFESSDEQIGNIAPTTEKMTENIKIKSTDAATEPPSTSEITEGDSDIIILKSETTADSEIITNDHTEMQQNDTEPLLIMPPVQTDPPHTELPEQLVNMQSSSGEDTSVQNDTAPLGDESQTTEPHTLRWEDLPIEVRYPQATIEDGTIYIIR